MDLQYGPEYEEFRAEVQTFLEGWPLEGSEADLLEEEQERLFRQRGIEAGYVYRQFPREYGGSGQPYDALRENIIQEEYARVGAPGNSLMQGPGMLVPTLLEMGSEAQCGDDGDARSEARGRARTPPSSTDRRCSPRRSATRTWRAGR